MSDFDFDLGGDPEPKKEDPKPVVRTGSTNKILIIMMLSAVVVAIGAWLLWPQKCDFTRQTNQFSGASKRICEKWAKNKADCAPVVSALVENFTDQADPSDCRSFLVAGSKIRCKSKKL